MDIYLTLIILFLICHPYGIHRIFFFFGGFTPTAINMASLRDSGGMGGNQFSINMASLRDSGGMGGNQFSINIPSLRDSGGMGENQFSINMASLRDSRWILHFVQYDEFSYTPFFKGG